jgi:hypothetical protein
VITEEGILQTIDDYATEINSSQDLNFKRWDNLFDWEHEMWGRGDYENNINIVKEYISERLAWLDEKLEYVQGAANVVISPEFENVKVFSNGHDLIISDLTKLTQISCYDVLGKIIFQDSAENDFSKPLPVGIYFVKLMRQNGANQTFKCVVK